MNNPPAEEHHEAVLHDDLSRLELRIARRADSLSPFYGAGREKDAERWDRAEQEELGLPDPTATRSRSQPIGRGEFRSQEATNPDQESRLQN